MEERELNACTLCGFTTDKLDVFAQHVEEHENAAESGLYNDDSPGGEEGYQMSGNNIDEDHNEILKEEDDEVPQRPTKTLYSCPHCNFKTHMSQHYRSHLESHSRYEHMYQCDICHMQFSQKANMHRHRMRHSGVKPYQCRFCLKRFFRKDHMQEHSMTHIKTGVSFECPLCDQSFRQHSSLKVHLDELHAVSQASPANCKRCNAIFTNTKRLLLHFQTRHDDENITGSERVNSNDQIEAKEELPISAPSLPALTKNVASTSSSMTSTCYNPMESGMMSSSSNMMSSSSIERTPSPKAFDYMSLFSQVQDRQNLGAALSLTSQSLSLFQAPQEEMGISDSPSLDSRSSVANEPVTNQNNSRQCPFCEIIFLDQTLYFLHKGLHAESDPWKCNLCGLACGNKYRFHTHVISADHS